MQPADQHPFLRTPRRTILALSLPVMLSLIAEPVTGMVDTAFVAHLGTAPLAALGIGTSVLSSVLWIFSFLGISAQTEVAQAMGYNQPSRVTEISSLALILSMVFGIGLMLITMPFAGTISALLGAAGDVQTIAVDYTRVRLLAVPAVMVTMTGFGVLRGLQDMRTPLYIAVTVNVLNVILDMLLINGWGFIPPMGVSGAALASSISQYIGAFWLLISITRVVGFIPRIDWADLRRLLRVGGDLFVRTGLLTFFLLFATRSANQINPEAGAAHQAIRTIWFFLAFVMEGYAVAAQSLVGYFLGASRIAIARQAAALTNRLSLFTGFALTALMLLTTPLVILAFVPPEAVAIFGTGWMIAAVAMPLAGVAFTTDGILWGSGDYTYMRNGMIVATVCGTIALLLIDLTAPNAFMWVWIAIGLWVGVRAVWGTIRIWPGIGQHDLHLSPPPSL